MNYFLHHNQTEYNITIRQSRVLRSQVVLEIKDINSSSNIKISIRNTTRKAVRYRLDKYFKDYRSDLLELEDERQGIFQRNIQLYELRNPQGLGKEDKPKDPNIMGVVNNPFYNPFYNTF